MNGVLPLNTPGFYYAAAYWTAAAVILMNNPRRFRGLKLFLYAVVSFLTLLGFMTLTDGVEKRLFPVCMAVIILILFFFTYWFGTYPLRQSAFYCMSAFICGEFSASLCWQLYYYMVTAGAWPHTAWVQGLELFAALVIVLTTFMVSNMSYLGVDSLFSSKVTRDIYIIRTLVDLSGAAVLYAYQIQMREVQLRFEKDTLQGIVQMQYQTYRLSEESIDIVNRKYHDLKHQIVLLKSAVQSEQASRYLEQMENEIRGYEAQNKTGSKVLDVVLTSKALYCQNRGIELKYMVQGELLDFMDDMDISVLFGNMLDNAIESVEKQTDREKRLICLYLQKERQFVTLRTENYCDEKLHFHDSIPVTTKEDKQFHGYGMKSIRHTVEKYGGSVIARQEDNWFRLNILFPLRQEE